MRTGETTSTAKWRAILARAAGLLVLLAGILLATGLCVASPQHVNPVPSIFDPRSSIAARQLLAVSSIYPPVVFAVIMVHK